MAPTEFARAALPMDAPHLIARSRRSSARVVCLGALMPALGLVAPMAVAGPLRDGFEGARLAGSWSATGQPRLTDRAFHDGSQSLVLVNGRRPTYVTHRFATAQRRLTIELSLRRERPGLQGFLTLPASRIDLADDGRGTLLVLHGSRRAVLARGLTATGGWNRLRINVDVPGRRIRALANGATRVRWVAVPRLRAERTIGLGAARVRFGPIYLDAINRPVPHGVRADRGPGGAPAPAPPAPVGPEPAAPETRVSVVGRAFHLNGAPTYAGTSAAGTLQSIRASNGIFDDENPETVANWAYPDTGRWDPERNTTELIAQLAAYRASGLTAITVGLQGGAPGRPGLVEGYSGANQKPIASGYFPDGSLKPAWQARADRLITTADRLGMVVIVEGLYFGQLHRLANGGSAVDAAIANTARWLRARGYANVIFEVENESGSDRAARLVAVARREHPALMIGAALPPGRVNLARDDYLQSADVTFIHGNGRENADLEADVEYIRGRAGADHPIHINEDSAWRIDAARFAMLNRLGVGNGYYDQQGFQSPAIDWTPTTADKRAFLAKVAEVQSR